MQGEAFTGSQGLVPLNAAVPVYPADPFVQQLVARYKAAEPWRSGPWPGQRAAAARAQRSAGKRVGQSGGRCPVGRDPRAAEGRCPALVRMNPVACGLIWCPDAQGQLRTGNFSAFSRLATTSWCARTPVRRSARCWSNSLPVAPARHGLLGCCRCLKVWLPVRPARSRWLAHQPDDPAWQAAGGHRRSAGGHQQLLASGGDGFTVFMEGETPRAAISIWMCWRPTCWHTAR